MLHTAMQCTRTSCMRYFEHLLHECTGALHWCCMAPRQYNWFLTKHRYTPSRSSRWGWRWWGWAKRVLRTSWRRCRRQHRIRLVPIFPITRFIIKIVGIACGSIYLSPWPCSTWPPWSDSSAWGCKIAISPIKWENWVKILHNARMNTHSEQERRDRELVTELEKRKEGKEKQYHHSHTHKLLNKPIWLSLCFTEEFRKLSMGKYTSGQVGVASFSLLPNCWAPRWRTVLPGNFSMYSEGNNHGTFPSVQQLIKCISSYLLVLSYAIITTGLRSLFSFKQVASTVFCIDKTRWAVHCGFLGTKVIMEGNGSFSEVFWCCYYRPPEDSPPFSKNAKASGSALPVVKNSFWLR